MTDLGERSAGAAEAQRFFSSIRTKKRPLLSQGSHGFTNQDIVEFSNPAHTAHRAIIRDRSGPGS